MLLHIVERASESKYLDEVIVATSDGKADDAIEECDKVNKFKIFRGNEIDVLERYYKCASEEQASIIVRLTGDNALIDSSIIDEGLDVFLVIHMII